MGYNRIDSKATLTLLCLISDHLASRKDCKGVEYRLIVERDFRCPDHMAYIHFWPYIRVFPDIHNRKPRDKVSILEHVLLKHCPATWYKMDKGKILISTYYINEGKYVYAMTNGHREWIMC